MKRFVIRILVFVLLLGLFYACGDFVLPHTQGKGWLLSVVLFTGGAAIAVWGNKEVGTIHPISFRSGYIILGVLLMVAGLLLMACVRTAEKHRANTAPTASTVTG